MKKRKLKKQLLFNLINTIIILFFVFFYGGRLVYYYLQENGKKEENVDVALVDELIKNVSQIDKTNGLVEGKDNTYIYKGDAKQNYVKYSGRIYRLIEIDSDRNMTMISDSSETILMPGVISYDVSYLKDWLNPNENKKNTGIYLNTLNSPYEFLEKTNTCMNKIDTIEDISCSDVNHDSYVSLLSLSKYKEIGGSDSYLNNKSDYFLMTQTTDNKYWYVASDGGINIGKLMNETHNIRPVITLRNSTIVYKGNGTKKSPYIIEENEIKILTDASVSEYVSYSGYTWKIIGKDEKQVKVVMNDYLKENDTVVTKKFGSNNSYSLNKNTLGYYLNNDFYNSLENKDLVVKAKWYYGKYAKYATFNYLDNYNSSLDAYVGLPNIGDMYVNLYSDIYLMTRPYGDSNIIYTINGDKLFFTDYVTKELKVRPVIYLKNTSITKGTGSLESPYVLGVIKDE